MPASWELPLPSPSNDESEYGDEDEGFYERQGSNSSPTSEQGRESSASVDGNKGQGLVRSASFGQRGKASIATTQNAEHEDDKSASPREQGSKQMAALEQALERAALEQAGLMATVGVPRGPHSPLAGGIEVTNKSRSSLNAPLPMHTRKIAELDATPAHKIADPHANATLGAYNRVSTLVPPSPAVIRAPSPAGSVFNRLSAVRRPPRLDMNSVKEAESRGSTTSLTDLIRRATRLAAMMDRGKRPGSRLALNDFPSPTDSELFEKETHIDCKDTTPPFSLTMLMSTVKPERRHSGFSGMIDIFPSTPGQGHSHRGTPDRPVSDWHSGYEPSENNVRNRPPRRCCGLPLWGFFMVLLVLLMIIAAAVVVPLKILVLDKHSLVTLTAVEQCAANPATTCQNDGTSVLGNGGCACICTNGFTGSTCQSADATGCTTINLPGSALSNVTIGDSISRLITASMTNFSVPLNETMVLARFNSANLSCVTENALVTFQGRSERTGQASDLVTPVRTAAPTAPATTKVKRQGSPSAESPAADSIVFDSTPTPAVAPPPSSSSAPIANSSGVYQVTEEALDFARVAVLYILQQVTVEDAIIAQGALNGFFKLGSYTNLAALNVSVGAGRVVDLLNFSVDAGAGPVGSRNSVAVTQRRRARGVALLDLI